MVVLAKNMITDNEHALSFRLVHLVIAFVTLSLAAATWPLARKLPNS